MQGRQQKPPGTGDAPWSARSDGSGAVRAFAGRVLLVTQSYDPFLDRGGPAFKVRAIARGLVQRDYQVTVLTSDLGFDQQSPEQPARSAEGFERDRWGWRSSSGGIEAVYLRRSWQYRSATWNPGIFSFCRERVGEFDVAHIFGLYDLLGPAVARACRKQRIPYVLEPIGMFRPIVRNIPLKWLYRGLLGESVVRGASRVVATAPQEKAELIEEGVPEAKIVIRRNGIDVPTHLPAAGTFRSQWGIAPDAQIVLFLGRLVSKKSPDLLLDAFARWQARRAPGRAAVLVLAGPDEGDGYRGKLETRANQLGVAGKVLFTGPIYGDAKWAAFRDASIFVLPSQNENFGNTAAEAVSCGTPVVVTDQCGIAPLVEGRAGLVIPHELGALAATLERLSSEAQLFQQLREGCAEVVRDLDWERPIDETEALYRALTAESGRERVAFG